MKTRSFNILMADDNPTIGLVVPMILRRLGHSVEVVQNGREAIEEFDRRPGHFQVLVTDHDMPILSGLEVVAHFREHGFDGKIVVMSGSLTDDLMHAYLAKRVDKIVQKPFTLEMLSVTFGDLLDDWNDQDEGG